MTDTDNAMLLVAAEPIDLYPARNARLDTTALNVAVDPWRAQRVVLKRVWTQTDGGHSAVRR